MDSYDTLPTIFQTLIQAKYRHKKYPRKKNYLRPLKDESDGELAHSVSLICKAKENILLWNDGIYKGVRKKPAWNDEPLRNLQGALYIHVEF